MLKQINLCPSKNTSQRYDLMVHATIQRFQGKLWDIPSQKWEILWILHLSTRNMPHMKPKELWQDIQAGDGITPPTLYSEKKVRAPKGGVLHRRYFKEYPPYSPPAAHQKERVSKREEATPRPEWKLLDMENSNRIRSISVTVWNKPHSFLIRATKKEEYRA